MKKTGNNPNLDKANMNVSTKLGEILSICSQDLERKQNSNINQGLVTLLQICKKNNITDDNPNLDIVNMNA